jgi:hypothetical protein
MRLKIMKTSKLMLSLTFMAFSSYASSQELKVSLEYVKRGSENVPLLNVVSKERETLYITRIAVNPKDCIYYLGSSPDDINPTFKKQLGCNLMYIGTNIVEPNEKFSIELSGLDKNYPIYEIRLRTSAGNKTFPISIKNNIR